MSGDECSTVGLQELIHYVSLYCQKTDDVLETLFELHGNNDEDAVNFQLDILNLYGKLDLADQTKKFDKIVKNILDTAGISPNRLFLFFCQRTGMDHSLLVDLLLSNETEFLLFFVKYLKYVERDPQAFAAALDDDDVLDMLRSLISVLQSGGFPYNPTYLIHRLTNVINLFE
ncbi:hypothetical protein BJV82DRAFT_608848 [Fennellomyces sp. T-0311]|nr:hypothetical protein BJV82DRAFT_608848 [Fennellomyces sp. T-0311]